MNVDEIRQVWINIQKYRTKLLLNIINGKTIKKNIEFSMPNRKKQKNERLQT